MLLGLDISDEGGFDSLDSCVAEQVVEVFDVVVVVVDYCNDSPMVMTIT
jgi:hypothetical protein